MIAVWIVLAVVYFVLAVATAVARRRWIIENGFLMSDDAPVLRGTVLADHLARRDRLRPSGRGVR